MHYKGTALFKTVSNLIFKLLQSCKQNKGCKTISVHVDPGQDPILLQRNQNVGSDLKTEENTFFNP